MQPIKVTETIRREIVDSIMKELDQNPIITGSLKIEKKFNQKSENKVHVQFSANAWFKMQNLVMTVGTEVAWHGVTERIDAYHYRVNDILLYPQVVTGGTVNTDQDEYTDWIMSLDGDVLNNMRFQGHSHVNMAVTPSVTDLTHQESILQTMLLQDDAYYIFMIVNKSLNFNIWVYDMSINTKFDTDEITIGIDGVDAASVGQMIEDKKKFVRASTISYYNGGAYHGTGYENKQTYPAKTTEKQSKKNDVPTKAPANKNADDDIDDIYRRHGIDPKTGARLADKVRSVVRDDKAKSEPEHDLLDGVWNGTMYDYN